MDRTKLTRAALIAFCASVAPMGAHRVMADAASHPPPPPLLLLYPATPGDSDDIRALASVRSSLRDKSYFDVMTYDVESPAVIRAANENHHQEWVDHAVASDDQRLALAHAMGADYYAVITHGGRDRKADIRMVAVADPASVWTAHDRAEREASLLQDDATTFASQPKPAPVAVLPAPSTPSPVAVAPAPSTSAPVTVAPAPSTSAPVSVAPAPSTLAPVSVAPAPSTSAPVAVAPAPSTSAPVAVAPAPSTPAPAPVAVAPAPSTSAPVDAHPAPAVSASSSPARVAPVAPAPPVAVVTTKPAPSDSGTATSPEAPVIVNEPSPVSTPAPVQPAQPASPPAVATAAPGVPVHVESVKIQPLAPTTDTGRAPDPAAASTATATTPPVSVATVPAEPTTPAPVVHPQVSTDAGPAPTNDGESAQSDSAPSASTPASSSTPVATSASGSSLNVDPAEMEQRLDAVRPLIARGDEAVESGEIARAISLYRQAIDGAPLSVVPRLKLAQAYLQGGFRDKALSEAKRALQVSPDSIPVQEFLIHLDSDDNTSEGAVAMYEGLVEKNPSDPGVHVGLGDAYWNDDDLTRAESEYKIALHLSKPGNNKAAVQLARLYTAQSRYDDALNVIDTIDDADRYPLEISLIQSRTDTLITTISTAREAFDAGKSSHEDFYDTAKKVSADAGALADFVGKITPPVDFRISHLHRQLAVNLIGQEADELQKFIETSDSDLEEQAAKFEKSAETEMLTAHAAEQKHGLAHEASGQ